MRAGRGAEVREDWEAAEPGELASPGALLQALAPRPGQRFLQLGCDGGHYFFPVFEAMGGRGVFLAAELREEPLRAFLSRLESYAEHPGFARIEVVRAKPDRLPLPDASADLLLLAGRYRRLERREAWLREFRRLLAPGGRLCLLDLRPEAAAGALPPALPEAQAAAELAQAGFHWAVSHGGLERHWCLSARA